MRVGFIGIGNMGWPMASHIAEAGHELMVFDVDAAKSAALCAGVQVQGGRESGGSRSERNYRDDAADGAESFARR